MKKINKIQNNLNDDNLYYREKDNVKNTLTPSEKQVLNKYLHLNIPYSTETMWIDVMTQWNILNPSHMVNPHNIPQPDYTIINEPK